ncbi:hypothetical protein C1645_876521 [Glomus cerebriforme]|uniref:Uncharacterized protein n=1 Tax=Glomus cerebriforme TaxID=658196 RepID=A0A397SU72_9GLOM|nr:hypothetical protein C1645_876521 [Glomus cerebriforme]
MSGDLHDFTQHSHILQIISYLKFYHFSQNDNNFYYVTCKIILQDDVGSFDDNDHYNHGFFFQHPDDSSTVYFVTCKLLPFLLIENILNNGMDFNNKCKILLSLHQKLNLEQSLRQKLFDLMRNVNSMTQTASMDNIQNYNDNGLPSNDHIAYQDTNIYPWQQVDCYQNQQTNLNFI